MTPQQCYHCGDKIRGKGYTFDSKSFCCNGCKSVYQLLTENNLDSFYSLEDQAGQKPSAENDHKYAFLDVDHIRQKFVDFEDENTVHVTLFLPQIHCSSCIYLLENLHKLDQRIQSSQVNFAKREASIVFQTPLALSELALLLDRIGYAPNFSEQKKTTSQQNKRYLYKLGVAGFAFGSIMLWSVPEYLGIEKDNPEFRSFTSYLSFIVSLPVLIYSANEYLVSAWKAIRYKSLNIDVPITIGIIALYAQSAYHIFAGLGPGYMDSFAGFVFFLLIGKWFQSKTYSSLSFERDYTSYFPVAVTRTQGNEHEIVEIDQLNIDDNLLIRNLEIIPCDSILQSEEANIDYSFVTGESTPVKKKRGDLIYAGGKLLGKQSLFRVVKESNRSHLTQLWNEASGQKEQTTKTADKLSTYFLMALMIVAVFTGIMWVFISPERITEVVVSVLIVACPCALALSKPFTFGNTIRVLGRSGLFLRSASVIEQFNATTDLVFDKTGTLTTSSTSNVQYEGKTLTQEAINSILLLANSSTHPLSRSIVAYLDSKGTEHSMELLNFHEISGEGVSGTINQKSIQLGADQENNRTGNQETNAHVSINGEYFGRFIFESAFRDDIFPALNELSKDFTIHLLSGDQQKDRTTIEAHAKGISEIHFEQSPKDKFDYVQRLKLDKRTVMMIGDGLNDSGALEAADVGIAVSEDIFRFTPSSDAIIEASELKKLPSLMRTAANAERVLNICYIFSILYNTIGLGFAISGSLTPLIAAILMPISSITIVLISALLVRVKA